LESGSVSVASAEEGGVRFGEALRFWLKLGFISFGGPAGQIAIMHQELVERKRWISERRFLHALNYCMLLPGPEAQQLATYIGWLMHRTWGGIVAGGLFVLPSLVILIVLSWLYMAYGNVPAVAGLLYGIKPAIVAIVLAAAWRIGTRALKHPALWAISVAAFVALLFDLPFPAVVIGAGLVGIAGGRFAPGVFSVSLNGEGKPAYGAAVIDDDTPPPAHARYRPARVISFFVVGMVLWAVALGALLAVYGWDGMLTRIGWFFTKAALLTFGGAYAVLPYVYQAAVENYGWLTPAQMIDGLALGETTPGPLIMVVAFVGFVAAWQGELFQPVWLAAAAGACVATFFTFLPSFVFILVGGPLVESTHGELRFTAPLTAITAAVVGVIVSLAVFFARHVFFADGIDYAAMCAAAIALVSLVRYRAGLIPVILVSGAAGMLYTLLG
jgi:chromate transporter